METQRWQQAQLNQAVQALKEGELVAFPTETVYGLGAMAENEVAVKKVYQAKGRPSDNPLIVHVAYPEMIEDYTGPLSQEAKLLMDHFWPGPLTMIFKLTNQRLSKSVTGGLETCAFRMPNHPSTLSLLENVGPLVGPSANTSGKPSPTTAEHVYHDLHGRIAGILDGGASHIGVESTVIDLSNPQHIMILRPGAISAEMLQAVVDVPVTYDQTILGKEGQPKAPGMKYKHYSPTVPVVMVEPQHFDTAIQNYAHVALLAEENIIQHYPQLPSFSLGNGSIEEANEFLFAGLRELDQPKHDVILAEIFPNEGAGRAYMNRLQKAAGGQKFDVKS